ncbi:MAG: energy transducer TonB [Oceanicaulis sp.]
MIEVFSVQAHDPIVVECELTGRMEGGDLVELGFACPAVERDPADLGEAAQRVADRAGGRVDERTLHRSNLTTAVSFIHDGVQWRLLEPTAFLRAPPDYPRSAAERGLNARCDLALTLTEDGRTDDIAVTCEAFTHRRSPSGGERFVEAARRAAEGLVYFMPDPGPRPVCVLTHFDFSIDLTPPLGGAVENAPACPGETQPALALPRPPQQRDADARDAPIGARRDCAVHAQFARQSRGRTYKPDSLTAICPDAPGLQAAADTALAAIDLDLPPGAYTVADQVAFTRTEGGWEPVLGQIVVRTPVLFPIRAVELGATHMLCALALRPDSAGRPEAVEAACLSDENRAVRRMEQAARDAAEAWRLLPADVSYCLDEQFHEQASVMFNGRLIRPGEAPDPAQLPVLCADG